LVQQAREILIEKWAFSVEDANNYMYEVAQARKLLIVEVAGRIVIGDRSAGRQIALTPRIILDEIHDL
jgi:hypothetical protein